MATQSNSLDKASPREFVRSLGNGLKNPDFSSNAPVRAPQRGASTGNTSTREETDSPEFPIALPAMNASFDQGNDAKHAFGTPSNTSDGLAVPEIDFAELKDGTLVEIIVEDSNNTGRTYFAVWKNGSAHFTNKVEQDDRVFVPLSRRYHVLRNLRLPNGATPYGSTQELLSRLEIFISRCVAIDEKFVAVLADFVLSTWFVDRFSVAPYLSVVGLPQSGKTTLLKVLSLVCRGSLLISDITSASFYRACAQCLPTMLIDETATAANDRSLRHILRTGTTRDVVAVRRNNTFHSYGAKVISWLEPPNDPALNSRCILIPMFESKSAVLARTDEPAVQRLAADFQARLLHFRFENYKSVQSSPVGGEDVLRPRTRDLLRALTAAHTDAERSQSLVKFFASGQIVPLEPLSPEHNAVLRALFSVVHAGENFNSAWIGNLTQTVNTFLKLAGENFLMQPRKVGAVLTSLGFTSRTRTNSGWSVSLDRKDAQKLHQLAAVYGIDGIGNKFRMIPADQCVLCREAGLHKKRPEFPNAASVSETDLQASRRS